MPVAIPPSVTVPFANAGAKNTIPVPSQIPTDPGAASFETGFPPATMTADGTPPSGLDFNGLFYMLSSWIVWLAAGGQASFNSEVLDNATGYRVGAVLQSATDPTIAYINLVPDNTNDPDSNSAGWSVVNWATGPLGTLTSALAAGAQAIAVSASIGFVDANTVAGAATITNMTGASPGQTVVVSNIGANALTIQANANFRMSANLTLLQLDSVTFRRNETANCWVLV